MQIDLAQPGMDAQRNFRGFNNVLRAQVCIAGAGIAGLVIARKLAQAGFSVTLLEAGGVEALTGLEGDPFDAELEGTPHAGTRAGRVCGLGGCSVTWGGQLLPLPSRAEWPVPAAELLRYLDAAEGMFGVDGTPYDARPFLVDLGERAPDVVRSWQGFVPRFSKFVPFSRRNLGALWGPALAGHERINVVLHGRLAEVLLSPERDRVISAKVQLPGSGHVHLAAQQYILAAGAVESCRVLLASRSVAREGVGNGHGQVGLRFGDHLTMRAATFSAESREAALGAFAPWVVRGEAGLVAHSLKMEASSELRDQLGIGPAMAHVTVEEPEGSGVDAVRAMLRARQGGEGGLPSKEQAGKLVAALPEAARLAWAARVEKRRYVSAGAKVSLQLNLAQDGGAASRVDLSEATDRKDWRKAAVHWGVSEGDLRGLRVFAGHVRDQMVASGMNDGAVWEPALYACGPDRDAALLGVLDDARHAMGGLCMGTDPRTSVVDSELRVHGVRNLSVASTAVFPDGSAQLPTLTLVLLCLRMAERLRRELA